MQVDRSCFSATSIVVTRYVYCLSLLELRFIPDNLRRFHKQRPGLTAARKLEYVASWINSTRNCISRGVAVFFLALSYVVAIAQVSSASVSAASSANHIKPYRVLLVVEHGSDPYGMVVRSEADTFQPVAALLKAWSVPFDILRLDQQHIDATYLFGRSGEVRYGAVLWLADLSYYGGRDLGSLEEVVHAGTGLIVVNSRVAQLAAGHFRLTAWPFAEGELRFSFPASHVRGKLFSSSQSLETAFHAAPVEQLTVTLSEQVR